LADGARLDGPGQRDATVGVLLVSGAGRLDAALVAFGTSAGGCGGAIDAVLPAMPRVDAGGSSARAFATIPRIAGSAFGAAGLVEGATLDDALCEDF
jgi:hypothetical protein